MLHSIPKNPFKFGIFVSRPHKKWAFSALFFVLVATALDRSTVVVLKNLTDSISANPLVLNTVWFWAIFYPVLFFMAQNMWRASGMTGMRWFMNFRSTAFQTLFDYLTLHSKDYFNSRFAGSLTNKISNAVDGSENLYEKILWNFLPVILGLGWYVFFAWTSDVRLGLIVLIWSVFFLTANFFFAGKMQPNSYAFAESLSTLKGRIVDSLSNISLVHEHAYVAGERDYIKGFIQEQKKAGLKDWWISEWVLVINGFLIFIFALLMIGTSVMLFQNHIVTLGTVIMVVSIVSTLTGQLLFIGQEIRSVTGFYGEAREGLEEILQEHVIVSATNAEDLIFSDGAISLNSVDFEYDS